MHGLLLQGVDPDGIAASRGRDRRRGRRRRVVPGGRGPVCHGGVVAAGGGGRSGAIEVTQRVGGGVGGRVPGRGRGGRVHGITVMGVAGVMGRVCRVGVVSVIVVSVVAGNASYIVLSSRVQLNLSAVRYYINISSPRKVLR